MEIIEHDFDNILKKEITIKMTIGDFISMYVAKMTCTPSEFYEYLEDMFPTISKEKDDLFTTSASTDEMEEIIDKTNFPHKNWLIV